MRLRLKSSTAAYLALSGALFMSASAFAETTLQSLDGSFTLEGELLSFDGDNYTIKTEFGELIVRQEFVTCSGDNCPVMEAETATDANQAVELVSLDGTVRMEGPLVEVTSNDYVIDTATGQLTVRKEFVTCEGAACPTTTVESEGFAVSVPGSGAKDLMAAIIGDFAASKDFNLTQNIGSGTELASLLVGNNKGEEIARISVSQMSNEDAVKAVLDGQTAFALTREQLSPETVSRIMNRRVDDTSQYLNEQIIGLDAVSFVTNANNQIDVIGLDTVRSILTGRIKNWSQLGGTDADIKIHMLSTDESIADLLKSKVTGGSAISAAVTTHDTADALNAAINSDPNAFGILYRSQADNVKMLALSSACNVFSGNSEFAIQTEEHPLAVRWYQYTAKDGQVPDFAENIGDYIATDFGQQSIASQGLVTQELRTMPMQDQGARLLTSVLASEDDRTSSRVMRDYLLQVSNAKRISTSLRFLSGATTLDTKAVGDIARISEIVRSREYDGYEVLIFGFSDSYGQLDSNLSISKRRAESVMDILLRENSGYLDRTNVSTYGIGPIAPVSCNNTDDGRQLNRRVEIWIRPKS